ncbi:MAG: peptidase M1, partial [Bryobacteraceae bacterium]|nr:peptidase M1 [Bryobacteraceae bacterium]
SVTFDFHDALRLSTATDETGQSISVSKGPNAFQFTLTFPAPLSKGASKTIRLQYDGALAGQEESPVYGIRFAAIKPEKTYLMYPARWFPVNDYTADRYTMTLKATVPSDYRVLSNGFESKTAAGAKTTFTFDFRSPGFPGNLALVKGSAQTVSANGVTSAIWFDETKSQAPAYGEEIGKVMTFLGSVYGLPPTANLTYVETERGAPNGYSSPGLVFLSPAGIGSQPNQRLLVNQLSRQWWGNLTSPTTRNHIWISNGMARYAETLYIEQTQGAPAAEAEIKDIYIEALTIDKPPLIQSSRLEDYSPEFVAATSAKGAVVISMLRGVMGDEKFKALLKDIPTKFANRSINTEEFKDAASRVYGQDLGYFFIQWIESTGTPEFKLEYTVFRTAKGFRVVGKVVNDLDTFRMPVNLKIETEGNPEFKQIEVIGTSSEFVVETFGKPKNVVLDPDAKVLRFSNPVRVSVAIRKGEQLAEVGEFGEALKEYQKALDVSRNSSLAHYRVAEVFFLQNNYQSAANEFREALNGDLEPKWVEVWSRINLGKIFDVTSQRERAVNEYNLAIRTKDNTQGAQEEAAKYLKEPYKRPARVD